MPEISRMNAAPEIHGRWNAASTLQTAASIGVNSTAGLTLGAAKGLKLFGTVVLTYVLMAMGFLGAEEPKRDHQPHVRVFSLITETKGVKGRKAWKEQFYLVNSGDANFRISSLTISVVGTNDDPGQIGRTCGFGVGGEGSGLDIDPLCVKMVPTVLQWDQLPLLRSEKNVATIHDDHQKEVNVTVERLLVK